jgi:ATP-dependent RNA helicase HelY
LAQFQADKAVVGLAKQIRKNEVARDDLYRQVQCHLGDFLQYASIREGIKKLETDGRRGKKKRHEIEEEIANLRKQQRAHSCHACPERETHARLTERAQRLQREIDALSERIESRTNVIARRFDRIKLILEKLGYIENDLISKTGRLLAKIYGETDLLIAESIQAGVFNSLVPADLVSVISACVYESRNEEAAKIPKGDIQVALAAISKIYGKIHEIEIDMNLEPMRAPDFGFCWAAHKWASGNSLTSILKGNDLTVGDFVRSMKQIIDLLRQLRAAAPELSELTDQALSKIDRGVVAYAGALV